MHYLTSAATLGLIFALLASGLNLASGYSGLLSLSQAAFYGIGAYTAALVSITVRGSTDVVALFAVCLTATIALVTGLLSLDSKAKHYLIISLGFQIISFSVFNNWIAVTGGPSGITGIPQVSLLGKTTWSETDFLFLCTIVYLVTLFILFRLVRSQFGRVLQGLREDQVFVQCFGKSPKTFLLLAHIITAVCAALAGVLYAYYVHFIDPTSFTLMESVLVLSIVVLGGAGNMWGPVIGAALLVGLPEALRALSLSNPSIANFRQILYGAALVLCMLFRPTGLVGRYDFGRGDKRP